MLSMEQKRKRNLQILQKKVDEIIVSQLSGMEEFQAYSIKLEEIPESLFDLRKIKLSIQEE